MSRGPSKWQRLILNKAAEGEWFYLVDLLPASYTESQYQALYRAACRLEESGRVSWQQYRYGRKRILLGPLGKAKPAKRPRQW